MAAKKYLSELPKKPSNPKNTNLKATMSNFTFKLVVYLNSEESDILHKKDVKITKKKLLGRWGGQWYSIAIAYESSKFKALFTKNRRRNLVLTTFLRN